MKAGNFTGIHGIPNQDMAMWLTMGTVADRTQDRLGASDLAIVEFRKTRRRNLLKVPTLITPGHPCSKNEQDRPMKWLKFGCKFLSKWLSF